MRWWWRWTKQRGGRSQGEGESWQGLPGTRPPVQASGPALSLFSGVTLPTYTCPHLPLAHLPNLLTPMTLLEGPSLPSKAASPGPYPKLTVTSGRSILTAPGFPQEFPARSSFVRVSIQWLSRGFRSSPRQTVVNR